LEVGSHNGNGRTGGKRNGSAGDVGAAREALILALVPLARRLARRYAGGAEQLDDLEQVGVIGLIKAASRFDEQRGVSFALFATPFIEGELKHHLRDNVGGPRVPRAMQSRVITVAKTATALEPGLGHRAGAKEIAARTGLTTDEVSTCLEVLDAQRTGSLDVKARDDSVSPAERLGEEDPGLEQVEHRHLLIRVLRRLDTRERSLLFLRLVAGRSHREAADVLGISQPQASRLFRQALEKARTIASAIENPALDGATARLQVETVG
jgi:RNA polymerase sigma-B factor